MRLFSVYILLQSCFNICIAQDDITTNELNGHITYLTADKHSGRYPGGKINKRIVRYIIKDFKKAGISPFMKSYEQPFVAQLRVKKGEEPKNAVETWNVIGFIEGNDPLLKNEYIVLGAHYDHLGMGGGPSSKSDKIGIHHGADDNASGTSALLEIGEKLMAQKSELKRSILLVAFGAEEQGLLGSKYFTDNPVVPLSQIKLMINMDMVGRLNNAKQVYMGGSDHVSFYKKNISVLGIHTGGHPQYHTPEDTVELINFEGQKQVCQYIFNAIMKVAAAPYDMKFIPQGE